MPRRKFRKKKIDIIDAELSPPKPKPPPPKPDLIELCDEALYGEVEKKVKTDFPIPGFRKKRLEETLRLKKLNKK